MAASITPQDREAAAAATRERKAQAERERRASIKRAQDALEKAGLPRDHELDREQRARAASSLEEKGGLSGKALKTWILEGKTSQDVIAEARAEQEQTARTERTRANVTRSADPEAAGLAVEAKGLAPDVKSSFLPKEAREFIECFSVELLPEDKVRVKRTDGGGEENLAYVDFDFGDLEAFGRRGVKDPDVRKSLVALGRGSRLWGRKLALMILAQRLRIRGAEA